jgi:hypothetical protein
VELKDYQSLVSAAVQPFLTNEVISSGIGSYTFKKSCQRLANEGAALLEGGWYGSEVILSALAAVECGADIVAADRDKILSNARLQAATDAGQLHALQSIPEGVRSMLVLYVEIDVACLQFLYVESTFVLCFSVITVGFRARWCIRGCSLENEDSKRS